MADFNRIEQIDKQTSYLIILSKKYGKYKVLIDTDSTELIKSRKWCLAPRKTVSTGFYIQSNKRELLHRVLTGANKGDIVDHINRDTFDNRLVNLRIGDRSNNNKNRTGYGRCPYKYMSVNKARKHHNQSYTIKFPLFKTRTFTNINEAKAYYIECLLNGGKINE